MAGERNRTLATLTGMRALADNRFVGRFRYRRWRRALVVTIAVGWTMTFVGWVAPGVPDPLWLGPILPTLGAIVLLVLATRNLTGSVDAFVDERDREVRDRAHRLGYWALGAPLGFLFGIAHSVMRRGTADGVVTLSGAQASGLAAGAVTLVLLYGVLPTAILGWSDPDPPHDEEDG